MRISLIFPILILAIISPVFYIYAQDSSVNIPTLIVFHSPNCHSCIRIKNEVIPNIEKKFKDRILIEYRDIFDIENYKLLIVLEQKHRVKLTKDMPVFYCQGRFLNGEGQIRKNWQGFINYSLRIADSQELPEVLKVDLVSRFQAFQFFTVASAGLIDGINPCAFTVIVFFMSFLALQGYIKKELIVIGLCFIFSVFVTYLLIGIGVFGFLYRIDKFWIAAKVINLSIGVFSISLAALALYDFFKFKKTGRTEGLTLQLPQTIKNRIHKIVGMHYRIERNKEEAASRRQVFKLIISALITGFLVSLLEAVCTGQTYLPTITFILKTAPFKLKALGYLLFYNLMFVVPLFIIFVFALFGVSSKEFSDILKKHILKIKIIMAILFFGLGIFLIWKA